MEDSANCGGVLGENANFCVECGNPNKLAQLSGRFASVIISGAARNLRGALDL